MKQRNHDSYMNGYGMDEGENMVHFNIFLFTFLILITD